MPFVNIKLVAGQTAQAKEHIAEATATAIHEATGLPLDGIWIVFEDVTTEEWFVGTNSVARMRAGPKGEG